MKLITNSYNFPFFKFKYLIDNKKFTLFYKKSSISYISSNTHTTRHFPAAIKEWKNSVYSFNNNNIKTLPSKDNMVNDLIKSYFYLSNLKYKPRSKRMRSARRKYTTKRIFVSRPEIKQTNDKVIVNIFTYNREKQFLLKKLFYYNRRKRFLDIWLNDNNLSFFSQQNKILLEKTLYAYSFRSKGPIHSIIYNIVKNNKDIYLQFTSNLLTFKDKLKLYIKLYCNVYKNNLKYNKSYYTSYNKNSLFLATKYNITRYLRKRKSIFKVNRDNKLVTNKKNINRPFYIRKKLKHFASESESLLKRKKITSTFSKNKSVIPYSGIKLKNEFNFLSFKFLLKQRKFAYARLLFTYYFLRYVLSIFNIKMYAFKENNIPSNKTIKNVINSNEYYKIEDDILKTRTAKRNKKSKFVHNINKNSLLMYGSPASLTPNGNMINLYFYPIKKKENVIKKIKKLKVNNNKINIINNYKPITIKVKTLITKQKLDNINYLLSNINYIITKFIENILIKSKITEIERKFYLIYKSFTRKFFKKYITKFLIKDLIMLNNYSMLLFNKFKFTKFLPNLKFLISKIYNKKTELNIVNLKYPYLNMDIYTNIIALKLRKKGNLLKILNKAIGLAKRPEGYVQVSNIKTDSMMSNLNNIYNYKHNQYKGFNLQAVLNKIYPRTLINNTVHITNNQKKLENVKLVTSKMKNILNTIKYKTLSGIKLQGAGRLSKRYTASRAFFNFKIKGNLRNLDYSRLIEYKEKSMSIVMLRNQVKANSQYSNISSKRRVGSFGIKGWISGY